MVVVRRGLGQISCGGIHGMSMIRITGGRRRPDARVRTGGVAMTRTGTMVLLTGCSARDRALAAISAPQETARRTK